MEELMTAVTQSLAPLGATWDGSRLRIGGAEFRVYEGYRSGSVNLNGISYRPTGRGRNRGYDVAAAVGDIVRSLPDALKTAERRKGIADRRKLFADVTGQASEPFKRSKGLTLGVDGENFYLKVTLKDLCDAMVLADMVAERFDV